MIKQIQKILIVLLVFVNYAKCDDDISIGNSYLYNCENTKSNYYGGHCLGYLKGVLDFGLTSKTWYKTPFPDIPAKDVSYYQLNLIVLKHMKEHPEKLNLATSSLIMTALTNAYGEK
jgi:hypothetical protein